MKLIRILKDVSFGNPVCGAVFMCRVKQCEVGNGE